MQTTLLRRRHVLEQRRLEHARPARLPPHSSRAPRATADSIQPCRRFASLSEIIGPMKVRSSFGSPTTSARVARDEPLAQLVVDRLVDQDALHPDAALAGLVEGAEHDALDGVGEVDASLVDDHRRVAAQLEHHLLLSRAAP